MNNVQEAAEAAAAASAASATKVMYLTSIGVAGLGAVTVNDLLAWVGIFTAVGGFFVNLYFRWRQDRRAERALKLGHRFEEHAGGQ